MTLMGHVLFGVCGLALLIGVLHPVAAPKWLLVCTSAGLLTRSFRTAVFFRHGRDFGHGNGPATACLRHTTTPVRKARDNPVNAEKWGKFTFCGGDDFALQPGNRFPRYWRGGGITEADMIGFLKGATVGTIIFLGSPAFAADIAIGRGIICDTQEQMERYVAVFKGNAKEALTTVNTEAKKEDACAAAVVAYLAGDTGATARNNDGDAFRVLKILVLGVVTDMGVQQVAPFPQFTIMKIDEISI